MRIYQEKLGSHASKSAWTHGGASFADLQVIAETEKMSGKIFAMERLEWKMAI